VPAGVPGFLFPPVEEPSEPQPVLNPATATSTSKPSNFEMRRRFIGTMKNNSAAAMPPPTVFVLIGGNASAAEAATVFTVSVAVPAAVPEIVTGLVMAHVGVSVEVAATPQVSATGPVNPPPGVKLTVEVPGEPAEAIVIGPLLLNTTVASLTVTGIAVVAAVTPVPVPVTVTV